MRKLIYCWLSLAVLPLAAAKVKPVETPEQRMLSHVERIVVVDSISVDKADFFRHYRLRPSAGTLLSGEEVTALLSDIALPEEFEEEPLSGFTNEFNDYLVWAQPDTTGYYRIAESSRLIDGSWSRPQFAELGENTVYPFMLDDGQTLYFADDGEESIGGFDIFVATKDPSDGEFLLPRNIGMPFNSIYDDYMMAYDMETGVGWWATDRNQIEDRLTIYVFVLTDERENVDPEDPDLLQYASLLNWQELQDGEQAALSKKFRTEIAKIGKTDGRAPEFRLPMPGGKTYTHFTDFKNRQAENLMHRYLQETSRLERQKKELSALRKEFSTNKRNQQLKEKIQRLEQQTRTAEKNLKSLKSEIYKLETTR